MSEKLHLTSAQRRANELAKMHEEESGYDIAKHIPKGMSASEALEEIEQSQDELTVEELRAQRHERLSQEFEQESQPNNAMELALKEALER